MNINRRIVLKGGDMYLTENTDSTYKILNGTALVYVIPITETGEPGRRLFVYEADENTAVPAYNYTDINGQHWGFGIIALEKVELEEDENSNASNVKEEFAKLIGLSNYEMEGFEEGLVEWYKLRILKEDGYIHKTSRDQKHTYEKGLNLIFNLFHKVPRETIDNNNHPIYGAVKYLCDKNSISIADFGKVKECCQKDITVENIARVSGFISRKIVLVENWYKKDVGPVLVYSSDENKIYACIPNGRGYLAYDGTNGQTFAVTSKSVKTMSFKGYMIYRPFDNEKLNFIKLLKFGAKSIKKIDILRMMVMTLFGSIIGLLIPVINHQMYDRLIPIGAKNTLVQVCFVILAFLVGNTAFSVVKNLSCFRLITSITHHVQNAAYDRLFNLPESFFRQFDSGDLASRAEGVGRVVGSVFSLILTSLATIIFSMVYLAMMIIYSPILSAVSVLMLAVYALVITILSLKTVKYENESMKLSGKTSAVLYQLLAGISKIRIAGVEDRALYEYLKPYTELREKSIKIDNTKLWISNVSIIAEIFFTAVLFTVMIKGGIGLTIGAFIAYISAFGAFSGAVMSLADDLININYIKPAYERIKPIIETIPELDESKELPGELTGEIEISNVDFVYDERMGNVLSGINLHIKAGEYIAIVGPSGCGKSTLLKLLLGFEKPTSGKIYYDGRDIESINKRELRKKFGVVLQDGKLVSGSVYENITISAPNTSYAKVMEVIKEVGLEEDIKNMPMGIHTVLSEECGNISGGQQQKILIARAIVSNPKILYFDEATSALDNITQAMICDSLEKMNVTRVVIAHRLSTVINCDRIIVMDNGVIAEQGSYIELMEKKGLFYNLANRQIV